MIACLTRLVYVKNRLSCNTLQEFTLLVAQCAAYQICFHGNIDLPLWLKSSISRISCKSSGGDLFNTL